ncbi:MAG: GNAT family N-acetyltransferase [Betaproteobacteria bacterium]|nr:MAG: GNAT family N-acetyltransferase [Betaproteobacteria bacterium]TAG46384.1 MAG: GNAT family N-acetyltransferase [Betaproteobacteria bacterium]
MHVVRVTVTENRLSNPARITPQMYIDFIDALGRGWLCEIDSHVVGFSFAERADHSIWALFVLPEFERRGIGKTLLQLATDWLFELGAERVVLGTEINTRADRFYAAQGWRAGAVTEGGERRYELRRGG